VTTTAREGTDGHSFFRHPHRTFVSLSLPVMLSLIAEPLTGAVDTAFVAQLGAAPLAALGAATTLLSGVFWIFNFLAIGTRTEVAAASGTQDRDRGQRAASLALALSAVIGAGLAGLLWLGSDAAARFMSTDPQVQNDLGVYLQIRLLGAPAVLLTLAGFGALQGLQDMRTPLWIAATANLINAALDPLLIFGWGPVPALGVAGAAWASTLGQWIAGIWVVAAVRSRLGLAKRVPWANTPGLLVVGRDLFLRTGLLTGFLLLATRTANHLGVEAGAAHQVVRQMWVLTAFLLDAYATTAQSLVAYFRSTERAMAARRVAAIACKWSVGSGVVLVVVMLLSEDAVARLLVPPIARDVFSRAWLVLALAMPLNAVSFVTDGIHWGTSDYRYLRNVMFTASAGGALLLLFFPLTGDDALTEVWLITGLWITVRAAFGWLRIWPGIGNAPLSP
jgi:MATE family multidrug resistance protein